MQVNVHDITKAHSDGFPAEDDTTPFVALHLSDGESDLALLLHNVADFDRLIAAAITARDKLVAMLPGVPPADEVNVCDVCEQSIYNNAADGRGWLHNEDADHGAVPSNAVIEMPVA